MLPPAGTAPAVPPAPLGAVDESGAGDKTLGEAGTSDERALMQRRLAKSDELIKQLKHIIKAQHGKIEELRQRLELEVPSGGQMPSFAVQTLLGAELEKEHQRTKDNNEQLTRATGRLKHENEKLRKECESLRKVNRRFRSMLQQTGMNGFDGPKKANESQMSTEKDNGSSPRGRDRASAGTANTSDSEDPEDPDSDLPDESSPHGQPSPRGARYSVALSAADATAGRARRDTERRSIVGAVSSRVQGFGLKLSRMATLVPSFWAETEKSGPRGVLLALLDSTAKLLTESADRRVLVTAYVSDPWLRAIGSPDQDQGKEPTLFYLDGKVTMEAIQFDGNKAESPQFASLSALPSRNAKSMAVVIQCPVQKRVLAVLQAVQKEDKSQEEAPTSRGQRRTLIGIQGQASAPMSAASKRSGSRFMSQAELPVDILEQQQQAQFPEEPVGFTDTHQTCFTIMANVAGGVLEQHETLGRAVKSRGRIQDCLEIVSSLSRTKSLADFEQRVKTSLSRFFRVSFVRILFYDYQNKELLISASQSSRPTLGGRKSRGKKKQCQSFGLDKGVVGKCAKIGLYGTVKTYDKVVRIQKIQNNPAIDAGTDGVTDIGHVLPADAGMMVGPMVFDSEDGSKRQLVGVVQLIEREREKNLRNTMSSKVAEEGGPHGEFSEEEEELFRLLLQGAAIAAWRTIETQANSAQEGHPQSLAQMLSV